MQLRVTENKLPEATLTFSEAIAKPGIYRATLFNETYIVVDTDGTWAAFTDVGLFHIGLAASHGYARSNYVRLNGGIYINFTE
jgi:hypothetical protein